MFKIKIFHTVVCFIFKAEPVLETQLHSNNLISEQTKLCHFESNRGHLSQSSVQKIIPPVYPCMKWTTHPCIKGLYLTLTVCT